MATFTTKSPGNWSTAGQVVWNEIGVPGNGDTVTLNHAVTGDTNITVNGITINAAFTLAASKILTLQGNVTQGNAAFIMSPGSGLVFSTTPTGGGGSITIKWLQGTASNQGSCILSAIGTAGSHITISKIGAGYAYFDGGNDGDPAIANCGGWDCAYVDFSGIHNAAYTMAIGSDDFGIHHRRFLHCTFSDCAALFLAHPYGWGATDKDWRLEDCHFTNVPRQTVHVYQRTSSAGSGQRTCLRNSFSDAVDINLQPTDSIDYNYFGNGGTFSGGNFGDHNFVRQISRLTSNTTFGMGLTNLYILADHYDPADPALGINEVGNPHLWNTYTSSTVNTGVVTEYPHEELVDAGDGLYSSATAPDSPTITRSLVLPSMTDDMGSVNLYAMATVPTNVVFQHNTIVGRTAQGSAIERDLSGITVMSKYESCLIVGFGTGSGADGFPNYAFATVDLLLPHPGYSNTDIVPSSAVKNNDIYYPCPAGFQGDTSGLTRAGWATRMTNAVDASNRSYSTGNPGFVDQTRCCATYAVTFLGASALPTRPALPVNRGNASWIAWLTAKRAALDVFHAALMANPTIGTAVWTWVRAGFVPTSTDLDPTTPANQAVDGLTRGAMEFAGSPGGGEPPPAPGRTGRIGKGGHGRPRRSA